MAGVGFSWVWLNDARIAAAIDADSHAPAW